LGTEKKKNIPQRKGALKTPVKKGKGKITRENSQKQEEKPPSEGRKASSKDDLLIQGGKRGS